MLPNNTTRIRWFRRQLPKGSKKRKRKDGTIYSRYTFRPNEWIKNLVRFFTIKNKVLAIHLFEKTTFNGMVFLADQNKLHGHLSKNESTLVLVVPYLEEDTDSFLKYITENVLEIGNQKSNEHEKIYLPIATFDYSFTWGACPHRNFYGKSLRKAFLV